MPTYTGRHNPCAWSRLAIPCTCWNVRSCGNPQAGHNVRRPPPPRLGCWCSPTILWTKHMASFPGQGSRRPQHPGVGPPKQRIAHYQKRGSRLSTPLHKSDTLGKPTGFHNHRPMPGNKCSKDMPAGKSRRRMAAHFPRCHCSSQKRVIFALHVVPCLFRRSNAMPKADVSRNLNSVINHAKIATGVRMILEGLGGPGA